MELTPNEKHGHRPLSAEDILRVLSAYNGSEEYGQKTKQYIDDLSVLLE